MLFAPRAFAGRSVANFVVGAPAGANADWTVRGAVTQGDISSWVVSGDYVTRAADARHSYDLGLSYSTQRYDGGNFAALRTRHRRQPECRRAARLRHVRRCRVPSS